MPNHDSQSGWNGHPGRRVLSRWAGGGALVVSGLVFSVLIAWYSLSAVNFFYPLLHDLIDVEGTISEYAPKNRYRPNFEKTTRQQRADLFRQLVISLSRGGKGLNEIQYFDGRGQPIGFLLRKPEIIHLKDVANLVDALRFAATVSLAIFAALFVMYWKTRRTIPDLRKLISSLVLFLGVAAGLIALYGAKQFFYQLHSLIFPAGHQWFFYYEESLMTMLMKAPDIFAYLAGLLVVLSLLVLSLLLVSTRYILSRRHIESATG